MLRDITLTPFGSDIIEIEALALAMADSVSLTAIDVGFNGMDQTSARLILESMKGKDMQCIGMASCSLGVEEAKILAEYACVMASLTEARCLHCVPQVAALPASSVCTGEPLWQQLW